MKKEIVLQWLNIFDIAVRVILHIHTYIYEILITFFIIINKFTKIAEIIFLHDKKLRLNIMKGVNINKVPFIFN